MERVNYYTTSNGVIWPRDASARYYPILLDEVN